MNFQLGTSSLHQKVGICWYMSGTRLIGWSISQAWFSLVAMVRALSSSVDVGKEVVGGPKVNENKLEVLRGCFMWRLNLLYQYHPTLLWIDPPTTSFPTSVDRLITHVPWQPMKIILAKYSSQSDVPADFNNVNKSAKIQTYQPSDEAEDSNYRVETFKYKSREHRNL